MLCVAVLRIGKGKKTHPAVWEKTLEHQLRTRSKIKEETYLESDSQIQKLNQESNLLGLKKQSIQKKMDDPDSVIGFDCLRFFNSILSYHFP